jgi:hypothetical protein
MKPTYTPEKIDEFVASAKKDVEAARSIFMLAYEKILDINIGDVVNSTEQVDNLIDKITKSKFSINKKASTYMGAVNMEELGEYPDNVAELDKLANELDEIGDDMSKLDTALEAILSAAEELTGQFYNK